MKQVIGLALLTWNMSILHVSASPMQHCRQCVIVTTDSWAAKSGTMSMFERETVLGDWRMRRGGIPVVVGKAGMAWGRGLDDRFGSDAKREGDNKAPAGIFILRGTFGYAAHGDTKMSYQQMTPDIICIDDPQSRHYNEIVNERKIDNRDWRSAEQMRRDDVRYKWGVLVDHNVGDHNLGPKTGLGSCIFLHVWIAPNVPTVGCTAMAENNIVDLIRWLDPKRGPLLVQMPRPAYGQYREEWNLPPLR
jgi:zinc D-Ala-D-Ala dipeptidase